MIFGLSQLLTFIIGHGQEGDLKRSLIFDNIEQY